MRNEKARAVLDQLMNNPDIGHTGDFSRGTLTDDDKGALKTGIQGVAGEVIMCFGKVPIMWHSMSPQEAREMAIALIEQAAQAEF